VTVDDDLRRSFAEPGLAVDGWEPETIAVGRVVDPADRPTAPISPDHIRNAGIGIAVGLILLFRLSPTRVVGTDVFHAAILLWAAGLAHVTAGNVDFGLAGTILLGSVPGVWLGSHWSVRVEPAVLRTTLAVVLIGAGLALLIKAGLDIPVAVIAPFPVAVLVLLVVTMVRSRRRPAPQTTPAP
jgi:hypothetical protein